MRIFGVSTETHLRQTRQQFQSHSRRGRRGYYLRRLPTRSSKLKAYIDDTRTCTRTRTSATDNVVMSDGRTYVNIKIHGKSGKWGCDMVLAFSDRERTGQNVTADVLLAVHGRECTRGNEGSLAHHGGFVVGQSDIQLTNLVLQRPVEARIYHGKQCARGYAIGKPFAFGQSCTGDARPGGA
jgi:hypothetical protein